MALLKRNIALWYGGGVGGDVRRCVSEVAVWTVGDGAVPVEYDFDAGSALCGEGIPSCVMVVLQGGDEVTNAFRLRRYQLAAPP